MTDYDKLSQIDFLPELPTQDLHGKARVIQLLLEESFFHPSALTTWRGMWSCQLP